MLLVWHEQVIPNLELSTPGSSDGLTKEGHDSEPTHFFGIFDGYVTQVVYAVVLRGESRLLSLYWQLF